MRKFVDFVASFSVDVEAAMSTKHTPKSCFRVAPSLCFKARLSAKPLLWNFFFTLMQTKLIFALSLVLKVRVFGVRKQLRSQVPLLLVLGEDLGNEIGSEMAQ